MARKKKTEQEQPEQGKSAFGVSEKEAFARIKSDWREAYSAMAQYHNEWQEIDAFYNAKQWKGARAEWKFNPVINYISYVVDTKTPQVTNSLPQPTILPTAKDDEEAAKLFSMVAGVIADRVDFQRKTERVVKSGLTLGIGWYKVYWDNSLKGGSKARGNLWKGDVCVEEVDPSNMYTDPDATCVEDCRYVIYAVPKRLEWIKRTFGVVVEEERGGFKTEIYDRPNSNTSNKGRTMLYEYWYKEDGQLNVVYAAGGKILDVIEDVYAHGRYPFIPFVPKEARKSIIGIGEPRNLMENQKILNKLVEMQANNAQLTATPIALVNPNSGINPSTFVARPGLVQPTTDVNNAVKWLEPPRMSSDVPALAQTLTEFMEKIGGLFDSATGETPGAVTAAAAIQMLQEQASIPIKGINSSLYASVKDVYEHVIELVKQFYTETRYFRIDGEDGSIEFEEFSATEHAEIDLDVKISANSGTPTSKAFIAQLAKDLFDAGLLPGSMYVDLLDGIPNKDKIVEWNRQQEDKAQQPQPNVPNGTNGQGDMPTQQPVPMGSGSELEAIYNAPDTPPQIRQMIDVARQQGAPEEQILQVILQTSSQM